LLFTFHFSLLTFNFSLIKYSVDEDSKED
jgi:hypothetical protein